MYVKIIFCNGELQPPGSPGGDLFYYLELTVSTMAIVRAMLCFKNSTQGEEVSRLLCKLFKKEKKEKERKCSAFSFYLLFIQWTCDLACVFMSSKLSLSPHLVSSHGSVSVSVCIGPLSEATERWQDH